MQYYSSDPNSFYFLAFNIMKDEMKMNRTITFEQAGYDEDAELKGYDIYIYEHSFPKDVVQSGLPSDGLVIISDPDMTVSGMDVRLGKRVQLNGLTSMTLGDPHPLTDVMNASRIGVTAYTTVNNYSDAYTPLIFCQGSPMILARNTPTHKTVVMPFNINRSSFFTWDFIISLYNVLNYYMPVTTDRCLYEVGESAKIMCKGSDLTVTDPEGNDTVLNTFPEQFALKGYGSYTVTTKFDMKRDDEVRRLFVKVPSECSSIFNVSDYNAVINRVVYGEVTTDLFVYVAAALLVLLVLEWLLQFLSGY